MTDVFKAVVDLAESLREAKQNATRGQWVWWTSNSLRRLSSSATGKDGDVAHAVRHRDGACDIVIREGDMKLVEVACNNAGMAADVLDELLPLVMSREYVARDFAAAMFVRYVGSREANLPLFCGGWARAKDPKYVLVVEESSLAWAAGYEAGRAWLDSQGISEEVIQEHWEALQAAKEAATRGESVHLYRGVLNRLGVKFNSEALRIASERGPYPCEEVP